MKKQSVIFKMKIEIVIIALLMVFANLSLFLLNLEKSNYYADDVKYNFLESSSSVDDFEYSWNSTWGGIYDDTGREVAADSQNNVYLVGYTDITGSDNCDIIISKYDINGQEEWVKTWGGGNDDKGEDIYIDDSDNIYVVGHTKSQGDTNGDVVIIKFDTMGNEIWNKTWGGSQSDMGRYINEDSFGNFYIAGMTGSFGDVDGDALLIKFNNIFEEQWNVTWGGSEQDIANKVDIDSNNYIYVVGHSESLDPSPGESDVFLLKYNSSGDFEWERNWGISYSQRGSSLAIDSNDNIYITGHTFGHPASSGKGYLLKYDSNGNYQWERIWGVNGQYGNYFYRIIIDDNDDLYISGCTKTYGIPNNYDALLLNYDTSGNQNWNKIWMGSGFDATPGICMDSQSNIYIVGYTDTDSVGGYDALIIKYKNTQVPEISIISPNPYGLYSTIAPDFNINIDKPDYNFTWYSLDGGSTNIYSNETIGTIDQSEWDKQGNGTVTITFYANNSLGNVGQAEVTVRKDILDLIVPIVTIIEPEFGEVFVDISPLYSITIDETSLDSYWYSLDDGQTNHSISELTGAISQSAWNSLSDGHVTLRFYAKDEAGNVGQSSVTITKRTTSEPFPPGIPGYDLYLLLGALSVVSILIIRKRLKS